MNDTVDHSSLLPRYAQARQYVENLIREAPYRPGDRLPSQKDLAAAFGVAQMTMNRAIEEMVEAGLLRRAMGRGTYVTEPARSAAPTGPIGLVTWFPSSLVELHPCSTALLRGLQAAAAEVGRDVLVIHDTPDQWTRPSDSLTGRADGFLFLWPSTESRETLARFAEQGPPMLVLGASWLDAPIPAVDSDNLLGVEQAIEHLAGLGHRRIAMVGAPEHMSNSADRHDGYRASLARRGLPVNEDWFLLSGSDYILSDESQRRLIDMVRAPGGPTAILGGGYELAVQAIQTMHCAGLRVPDDVSVVGFDDSFSAVYLAPALTTVVQPLHAIGRRAALRLDALLRGQWNGPTVERLPTSLVLRSSTGARVEE